jgi:hypothetical protein
MARWRLVVAARFVERRTAVLMREIVHVIAMRTESGMRGQH